MNYVIFCCYCDQKEIWLLSHHFGNALISNTNSDFSFLRLSLSICHTDDVCDISGLNVTHRPSDGHIHFMHVGAVR